MKVLLTGLPNSGKTYLFNRLTGTYDIEANYAYTTMAMRQERINRGGRNILLTDSPGFHGLFIHSEEEQLLRDFIVREKPDILLHCIDNGRFRKGLSLALDLADLNIPMAIVINHVDGTDNPTEVINGDALSQELGVPVSEIHFFGPHKKNRILSSLADSAVPRIDRSLPGDLILEKFLREAGLNDFREKRVLARLILQRDPTLTPEKWGLTQDDFQRLSRQGRGLLVREKKGDYNHLILGERVSKVESLTCLSLRKKPGQEGSLPERLARISRHPLYGIPLLILTLFIGYLLVVNVAGFFDDLLSRYLFDPLVIFLDEIIGPEFLKDMLIGEYGIVTLGLIGALVTVLPVLTVFFFFFAIVEDTGYLPNLMVLLRKTGEKIGLSGKSLMPLLLGFGCKTMATLSTKTISSRREKLIAIYLIGFAIPCSAQMGLNMAILGKAGTLALLVALVFLVLVEVSAGLVLNRYLPRENALPFIQELPPFRMPHLSSLLRKTGFRIASFLRESLWVFMVAAVFLYLMDLTGFLMALKNVAAPVVVHWLGLPLDMVEGLLLILARNEAGAGYILTLADKGMLTVRQTILAVVLTTMFVPCFNNMVAMVKESGRRTGLLMILAINVSSLILAGGLNFLIKLVWKGAA